MSRSFGVVENKVLESEFFLNHILNDADPLNTKYFMSAFLTSTRSITFAIQAALSGMPGFEQWYAEQQGTLEKNKIAQFCKKARNKIQKEADYCIAESGIYREGKAEFTGVFLDENGNHFGTVKSVCKEYFLLILDLVLACFMKFGKVIDPEQYYTLENFKDKGIPIEDAEEEFGFPRGWTSSVPDSERMRLLRKTAPKENISPLFEKYLKKDKYGATLER